MRRGWRDHRVMVHAEDVATGSRVRRRRSLAEKRQIVRLTMEPGASVAEVARANGVNANQVFTWRRAFGRGELVEAGAVSTALLPVTLPAGCEPIDSAPETAEQEQESVRGAIHIELPGRAMISVERGADPLLLRSVLESLRK
jgi:transposase